MLPHSYTVDSLSRSQTLASTILSSSSPSQISSTCASIESYLHSHSPDQSRHFFSVTFPALICKLFGFDDVTTLPSKAQSSFSGGWIDTVLESNDPDLAARVYSLMSVEGTLLSSIEAVDSLSLVKYIFPNERLPQWARFMLSKGKDCQVLSDLSPLFKGKLTEDSIEGSLCQVQLNIFEYYMFWFAYYPVCRGSNEKSVMVSTKKSNRFRIEKWAHSIPGFHGGFHGVSKDASEQKMECNLYIRLLYTYLRAFVPVLDLNPHQQPYRSSLLHYTSGYDGSIMLRAEFLVNAFVHYWLIDNDFSPFPVSVCKSFGVSFPFRSVLGETPPSSGLGEAIKLFIKYLNLNWVAGADEFETNAKSNGTPRWMTSRPGSSNGSPRWSTPRVGSFDSMNVSTVPSSTRPAGCWNSYVQRPLYRFILRAFLFCPVGTSIKNASEVFSVWVSFMEPWAVSISDFADLDAMVSGSAKNERKEESEAGASGYTSSWQGYVLSNYLYYSSLVMHFIGFAHKFLHTDPAVIVQMVLKVMNILTSSKELMDLVKNVNTVFHNKQSGSGKSILGSLCKFVPSICEQLQDWEEGLCESDADGSFLHDNWNKDLRLFSDGEDGGQQLLQLFILRAEAELQAIPGDTLTPLASLKAQVSCLFGGHTIKPISFSLEPESDQKTRDEIFKPRRVGNQALADIKYKGDTMYRPISEDEVAWLAKLLVNFSSWLNEKLGLNKQIELSQKVSYVEVSDDDVGSITGPLDTVKVILCAIGFWLMMLGAAAFRLMKRHGLRFNFRVLASKKFVMILLVYAVFCIMKKVFRLIFCR